MDLKLRLSNVVTKYSWARRVLWSRSMLDRARAIARPTRGIPRADNMALVSIKDALLAFPEVSHVMFAACSLSSGWQSRCNLSIIKSSAGFIWQIEAILMRAGARPVGCDKRYVLSPAGDVKDLQETSAATDSSLFRGQ